MLKCDLLIGLVLGALTGMAVMEFCKPIKDAVDEGKEKVKSKIAKL